MTQMTSIQTTLNFILKELLEMRKTLATKEELNALKTNMATKDDVALLRKQMATKDDIALIHEQMATKDDISSIRKQMATKDDIADMATKSDIQNLSDHVVEYTNLITDDLYSRVDTNSQRIGKLEQRITS